MKLFLIALVVMGHQSGALAADDKAMCTKDVKAKCLKGTPTVCKENPTDDKIGGGKGLATSENDKGFGLNCVAAHNEMRRNAFTGEKNKAIFGADMREIKWNNELAAVALRHARIMGQKDKMDHDECRNSPNFDVVGQNIASGGDYKDRAVDCRKDAVLPWNAENATITSDVICGKYKFGRGEYGHYSQVMWAKTTEIGCGYVKFNKDKLTKFYIVCNYAPSGNYEDASMFKCSTSVASACPTGTKAGASKLCEGPSSNPQPQPQPQPDPENTYDDDFYDTMTTIFGDFYDTK